MLRPLALRLAGRPAGPAVRTRSEPATPRYPPHVVVSCLPALSVLRSQRRLEGWRGQVARGGRQVRRPPPAQPRMPAIPSPCPPAPTPPLTLLPGPSPPQQVSAPPRPALGGARQRHRPARVPVPRLVVQRRRLVPQHSAGAPRRPQRHAEPAVVRPVVPDTGLPGCGPARLRRRLSRGSHVAHSRRLFMPHAWRDAAPRAARIAPVRRVLSVKRIGHACFSSALAPAAPPPPQTCST